jgi:serine/threonine-protein kinase RsbW
VIRHGCVPGQDCCIKVRYRVFNRGIELEVSDRGRSFGPLSLSPPDLTVPIEQRKAGGLGVFLVRKIMDEVRCERRDGRNCFLFRKYWRAPAESPR